MRIGIVGTGIAGLSAGWILNQRGHDVTLFEKHAVLGMDAHSIDFEIQGKQFRCDVPPRMFNNAQWPKLCELYQTIGVEREPVSPTKSFSKFGEAAVLNLGESYLPKLAPNLLLNQATRKILSDVRKMMNAAESHIGSYKAQEKNQSNWMEPSFAEYLEENDYSKEFVYQFLYPALSSTVCTCSYSALDRFPASVLLKVMLDITSVEGLFRTENGTRDVVSRLTQKIGSIQLETPVARVFCEEKLAFVLTDDGRQFEFDQVVVATQANATLAIVDALSETEIEVLGSFQYENVETIVHTDESLMPSRRKDWAAFNQISNDECSKAMCSIWLNEFYSQWKLDQPFFQTIMPFVKPDPQKTISVARMQRPVLDAKSLDVQKRLAKLQSDPARRIWFTGSYAFPGLPLLESGVCSSFAICDTLMELSEFVGS